MEFSKVSVIISTYSKKRLNYVLSCLESLEEQSLSPHEILLVLDPDESLIETFKTKIPSNVKIVTSDGYGLSKARNSGIIAAQGEIVAFIDDDAFAEQDWLERLVENYVDSSVIGVGGLIVPLWESQPPQWFPNELNWIFGCSYKGLPESRTAIRNPIGCNMSFRRKVFAKVGFFNVNVGRFGKKLLGSEETELSIRILRKFTNSKIIYDPSALVYHRVTRERTRVKYLFQRSFYEGLSKGWIATLSNKQNYSLSTESGYLKYLLQVSIPTRLKRLYDFKCSSQLLVLLFAVFLVFAGFTVGKIANQNSS